MEREYFCQKTFWVKSERGSLGSLVFFIQNGTLVSRSQIVLLILFLLSPMAFFINPVEPIDCFKCSSINNSDPICEDPFHNNNSMTILESPCMGGRKGRNGLFPATACIKLAGKFSDSGVTMVVRSCAVDSGTATDTEILRMSHCGAFFFDEKYVKGCLQSCDRDGCNNSHRPIFSLSLLITSNLFLLLFLFPG